VGQKESSLICTEIDSSSEYKLENETSTGSILSLYTLLLPTPSLPSSSLSLLSLLSYTINKHDLHAIIRQQQEQLAAIQGRLGGGQSVVEGEP